MDAASARSWWRYAIAVVEKGLRRRRRVSWAELQRFCHLRREYVPYYTQLLLEASRKKCPF